MDVINKRVAGLDVHKKNVTACVRILDDAGRVDATTRTFQTMTDELRMLRDWCRRPLWLATAWPPCLATAWMGTPGPGSGSKAESDPWLWFPPSRALRHGRSRSGRAGAAPGQADPQLTQLAKARSERAASTWALVTTSALALKAA